MLFIRHRLSPAAPRELPRHISREREGMQQLSAANCPQPKERWPEHAARSQKGLAVQKFGTVARPVGLSITLRSAGFSFHWQRPAAICSRFCLNTTTHCCTTESSVDASLEAAIGVVILGHSRRARGLEKVGDLLVGELAHQAGVKTPSFFADRRIAQASVRRQALVQNGLALLGAPSVPTLFQTFMLDHPLRFIFAESLLVNKPPVPKVAPTSCTSITDLSQVVVKGCVVVFTSTLWQTRRCWGGLLSLCWMNAASSLRPSLS